MLGEQRNVKFSKGCIGIGWTSPKFNRCQNMDTDDWAALITEMSNELEKEKQFIPNLWSANAVKGYTIKSKWNRFNFHGIIVKGNLICS